MQSEQRLDNTESKATSENVENMDKIHEKPQENDAETNSSEEATANNSNIVNGTANKDEDHASHKESSEIAPSESPKRKIEESQPASDKDEAKDEGNAQDHKNNESKESDEVDSHGDNGNTENQATQEAKEQHTGAAATTETDATEHETSPNTIPPPKPPRIKSGNAEDTSNEKGSLKENDKVEEIGEKEDGEETKASDERNDSAKLSGEKPESVISKAGETIVDTIENLMDKVEEDGHAEESEKAKVDGIQDDVDVIQSPAPRTGS